MDGDEALEDLTDDELARAIELSFGSVINGTDGGKGGGSSAAAGAGRAAAPLPPPDEGPPGQNL